MKKGVYVLLLVFLLSTVIAENETNDTTVVNDSLSSNSDSVVDSTGDTIRPEVVATSPADGDTLSGDTVVRATATDNVGVVKVEFVLDGVVVYTATEPTADGSYEWAFDARLVDDGLHALVIAPYDAAGNFNDFSTIQISVANAVVPAPVPSVAHVPPALPALPAQSRPPQSIPRVEQSAPAEGDVITADDTQPLWQTLLMSFVAVVVVSGVLFVSVAKLRRVPEVPDHIKEYVYMSLQQGYPMTSIKSALFQQGWDEKVVDEAFKEAIGVQHDEFGREVDL